MPRKTAWGTPSRTPHYPPLRRPFAVLRPGLLLLAGVLGLGALLLFLPASLGLRSLVSPGGVAQPHADFESQCLNCHLTRGGVTVRGVTNIRCERCHDAAAGGTLDHSAHLRLARVRERGGPAATPGRLAEQECAWCHVEHRGRGAALEVVDEGACRSCHFSFAAHPELYYVAAKQVERTGFVFDHKAHVTDKGLRRFKVAKAEDACGRCHEPNDATDDFFPISYERHCSDCHSMLAQPPMGRPMEPVPARLVTAPTDLTGPRANPDEFLRQGDSLVKTQATHRDEWVAFNLRKLAREVNPSEYEAERHGLLRRQERLTRRLELAQPLAAVADEELVAREGVLRAEIGYYDGRLRAQEQALEPTQSVERLRPVLDGLTSLDPGVAPQVQDLRTRLEALRLEKSAAGLPAPAFEEQRRQLLAWVGRLEELDPSLAGRLGLYRRRIDALQPGETSRDLVRRLADQRGRELRRVLDERDVRSEAGLTRPVSAERLRRERPFRDALRLVEASLEQHPPLLSPVSLAPAERDTRTAALTGLARACDYCHVFSAGLQERVVAARPVLQRARFTHEAHVRLKDCVSCHPGIADSQRAEDLHLPSLASCRECHNPQQGKQECRTCHLYHPREEP